MDLLWDLDEVMGVISDGFDVIHAEVESIELDESDLHRGPAKVVRIHFKICLLYTYPSPRHRNRSRMPYSA